MVIGARRESDSTSVGSAAVVGRGHQGSPVPRLVHFFASARCAAMARRPEISADQPRDKNGSRAVGLTATHHPRRFGFHERRRVHAVLARPVPTLGYCHGPSPGSPPRNNRPELRVDLGGGVEHRSDVRFKYDRDNWALHVGRKSVRFGLRIIELVLVTHGIGVSSIFWTCFLHNLCAHAPSLALR